MPAYYPYFYNISSDLQGLHNQLPDSLDYNKNRKRFYNAKKKQETKESIRELETRLNRSLLACEALWSFVSEKLGVSYEQFVNRINEIDLSDGKLDGQVRKETLACPNCHKDISPWLATCPHCKEETAFDPFA